MLMDAADNYAEGALQSPKSEKDVKNHLSHIW